MQVALIKALAFLAGAAGRRGALALGAAGAWFARVVLRYRRVYLQETLRRCLPERTAAELRDLERQVYRHFGYTAAEFLRSLRRSREDVARDVRVEGEQHWHEAASLGKGLLILTGHIGNWELMGAAASALGFKHTVVVKHLRNEKVDAYLRQARERKGMRLLSARHSHRECLRTLKRGEAVVMVLDQNMHRDRGVFVDFFGRPACTTAGLAVLAAQSGAPVVPAYMVREDDGTHTLTYLPRMEPPPDRRTETLTAATQEYTRVLERIIRGHPDQWTWFHYRWRTRPPETPERASHA